ncbi:trans-sialidase, putative [Trypanosoma cruzi marinkellei]|uniref:Trans-sialidase, putative n=1 Tax=Trypanosoma cruzi marinkellei TaxID=85056 RepID=K2NIY0_TRYCR|nr:trans-sialidase, putative [Trypanosoma cruzi marinkellei]
MGPSQRHHFANKRFILVAPVSIHEVPKAGSSSSIPLMCVKLHDTGHTVLFVLSYTNENKWEVTFNGNARNLLGDPNWVRGKTYRVALGMDYYAKDLILYMDGSLTCDSEKDYGDDEDFLEGLKTVLSSHSTSHFYIGGDRARDSDDVRVTASNVLLYNRIMSNARLRALMKKNAVSPPETKMPASKAAPQNNHASETLLQSANEAVVINEERQDATPISSSQSQHSPGEPLGNENGPAFSTQTSSVDALGPPTSADTGEVKEEAPRSGGMAPAFSPTLSAGSCREVLETKTPFSGERPEGGQEPLPPNVAASTMTVRAGKADEGSLRNGNKNNRTPHGTSCDVFESVHNEPSTANTLASDEQDTDPEEGAHACTAVVRNSGLDSLSSTDTTPADGVTETAEPSTDPATVQRNDNVLGGVGTAPTCPSTAPGETKIPSELNAAPPLRNDLFDLENITELVSMGLMGDSTVHGCVSRV